MTVVTALCIILALPIASVAQTKKTNASKNNAFAKGSKASPGLVLFGKYGCTASKYRGGSYEYIPRGSFTLNANGKYTYLGMEKPSSGNFVVDNAGNITFTGGYLNGGNAEKIDRPNKFFLVFPTIPDNRWTCGLVD